MATRSTTFHLSNHTFPIDLATASDPLLSKDNPFRLPTTIMSLWKRAQALGMPGYLVVLAVTPSRPVLYDGTNLWAKLRFDDTGKNPLDGIGKILPGQDEVIDYGVFLLPCLIICGNKLQIRDATRNIPAYRVNATNVEILRKLFEEALNPYIYLREDDRLLYHVEPLDFFVNRVTVLTSKQLLLEESFHHLFPHSSRQKLDQIKRIWRLSCQEHYRQVYDSISDVNVSVQSLQAAMSRLLQQVKQAKQQDVAPSSFKSLSSDLAEQGAAITSPPSHSLPDSLKGSTLNRDKMSPRRLSF